MNRYRGFTLIELIITVAIAAIVLAVGVPSFQTMMRNNRAATYTNEFMSALNFARSEAIKRGLSVTLCPSADSATCAGVNWEVGWITFVDVNNDGVVDAGDTILRLHDRLGGNTTLQGARTRISYGNTGATAQTDTLVFSLCDSNNQQNNIMISNTGRARVSKVAPTTPCTD